MTKKTGWFAHQRADEDPLAVFELEAAAASARPVRSAPPRKAIRVPRLRHVLAVVGGLAVAASLMALPKGVALWSRLLPTSDQTPGNLTLNTRPAGVTVLVDDREVGTTPLNVALPPGEHRVTLRRGTEERQVPVTLAAGAQVTQYLEFSPDSPAALGGKLAVVTDPPGARVQIDGVVRGTSPVTIGDLTAAQHTVSVTSDAGSATRTIMLENGATASVVFSLVKVATPSAGWVTLAAPIDVQISEDDEVVATGRSARIMLPVGRHAIRLRNDALQYDETRQVEVVAGKTTGIKVDPPKVPVSVNARPWADVSIDGVNAGQTPISNLSVALGQHEVVFRHPQLGERRRTMVVTRLGVNRLSVDLTQP